MNQSNENSKKNLLKCVIVCGSVWSEDVTNEP
jgi:hypothetical protein